MSDAASRLVRLLYDRLEDREQSRPACALVRFYKTHPYGKLAPGAKQSADTIAGVTALDSKTACLTLLATAGEVPAWNAVESSRGHRAIPLVNEEAVALLPMVSQLVSQLGVELGSVLRPDPTLLVDADRRDYNVFYVRDALGSPYVPAQEGFVLPFGIKSVLGFGGLLSSGELFALILFSKVELPESAPALFRPVALSAKFAVMAFADKTAFAQAME